MPRGGPGAAGVAGEAVGDSLAVVLAVPLGTATAEAVGAGFTVF
jgi:hypothetical protein